MVGASIHRLSVFTFRRVHVIKMIVFFQAVPPDSKLQPSGSFPGHELHGGHVALSPHLRWLGSCSPDGKLLLRAVGALVRLVCISYFI